jgi:alpha-tubulin suppressor-like RCC1 family protein
LSWGSGQNGKLGHGSEDNISIPCFIPFFEKHSSKAVHISAGCEHSAAITADGSMFSWGHGDGGRLGHGDNGPCFTPKELFAVKEMNIT